MSKYDEVLRPFLALMEKELHANAGKGDRPGWLQMDSKTAVLEVFYHMGKLHQAVHRGEAEAIKEYAADVANMCMMLVDVCGLLHEVERPAPVAVVLPQRRSWSGIASWKQRAEVNAWNACLDEVACLNSEQKP